MSKHNRLEFRLRLTPEEYLTRYLVDPRIYLSAIDRSSFKFILTIMINGVNRVLTSLNVSLLWIH